MDDNNAEILKPDISENREITNSSKNFDMDEVWKITQENIRMYMSPRDFKSWFGGMYLEKIENGMAEFSCETAYKRDWIAQYYRSLVRKSLLQATGQNLEILLSVRTLAAQEKKATKPNYFDPSQPGMFGGTEVKGEVDKEKLTRNARLNPKYKLRNFIVGGHNRLAYAVGEAVVEDLGRAYNPVFYYGPTGVGKTHLMQAIGNEIIDRYPEKKVVYVPIEQFLNELLQAIRTKTNDNFRSKYREIDLLIIDDIQFVETYPKTQEELFHTFNALYQANKQIIMAADRPPKELVNITDRLRSRFEGGMVADIQAPDYETRMVILQQVSIDSGIEISKDIIELIAKNVENSVRELEGAATKVISMKKLGTEVDIQSVARMLQVDIESKRKRIKPENIITSVCEVFDVSPKDIKGKRRTAYLATARQIIMYLLRSELGLPLERVAKEVNRQDHTTVLHACEKIEEMTKRDLRFREKIDQCRAAYQ